MALKSPPKEAHGTTAKLYREKIAAELKEKFGYTSAMEVPRLTKITLNMGVSEAVADKKVMDNAVADLTKIAGQKPVVTKAKKAIAGFKIREGQAIGCMDPAWRSDVRIPGPFRDRGSAPRDFRGIRVVRSTVAATTTLASKNKSSSPKSSTTRWTLCVV
jgi:hypothetical protein